jgi:outer membrane protein
LQFGVDYMLNEHWLVNVDVKKLFLSTDVSLNGGAITADVDINPWIVGAGIGYRF